MWGGGVTRWTAALFSLWDEVVGCIVLGSHPHWEMTIQPTVFLKVTVTLRQLLRLRPLPPSCCCAAVTRCPDVDDDDDEEDGSLLKLLMRCEVVDCIVLG